MLRSLLSPFKVLLIAIALFILSITIGVGSVLQLRNNDDCSGNNQPAQVGTNIANINGNTTTANVLNNEKIVWNYLKSQGWSTAGACALMGRIMDESTFNPNATDSSGHHGIAQWDAQSRWPKAEAWIKAHGHDPNSIEGQIMYEVYEMQTSYPKVYNDVKNATNAISAVEEISKDYEVGIAGNAIQDTKAIEASFGNGNDKTTTGAQAFPAVNTTNNSDDDCNIDNYGGSNSGASGDIDKVAQEMLGYFSYSEVRPPKVAKNGNDSSIKSVSDVDKNGLCDCSGFVWLVLKICGYRVPSSCWYTGSMQSDARGSHKYLKQVDEKDAKAGDIVIVNDGSGEGGNGHTAILMENWHGNSTKIINMGGISGRKGVNIATFQQSFLSLLNGGTITLAEPVK